MRRPRLAAVLATAVVLMLCALCGLGWITYRYGGDADLRPGRPAPWPWSPERP